ncbi:MAG: NirD/YgiW/YdeI family stress tolerance protein [Alphaproteobacteria bacterium]|nr:NirD/YgiW/YdeI family stress tolerance protein [Alphaproteobacteria bacterium]
MKKLLTSTALAAAVLLSLPVSAGMSGNHSQMAQPAQQAAQNMQQPAVMTIEQVQTLGDDVPVVMEGMITQAMGDEMYTFQDANGNTIMVEIDDEDWGGLKPDPNTMVVITGETDKKGNIVEIDVDTIALKN